VVAGGGFLMPSVSCSKNREGESTGRPFDEGETKTSGQRAVSTSWDRRRATEDGARCGGVSSTK
jgi:hypothetical protein